MGGTDTENESYLKKCFSYIWGNLPFILLGNAVFLLFCAPSFTFLLIGNVLLSLWAGCVTVAPAFSGLLSFVARILRDEKPNFRDLTAAILRFYWRSALLGSIGALSLSWLLSALSCLGKKIDLVAVCLLVPPLVAFLFVVSLLVYAFPAMVLWDLPFRKAFVRALLFASCYRIPTAGLVSLGILFALLTLWSKMGLLVILPSVWAVFSCELTARLFQGNWWGKDDHSS